MTSRTSLLTLMTSAWLFGCTDVSLMVVGRLGDQVAMQGEFCTSAPELLPATTRYLFMVDSSGSMEQSDPTGLRFDAIQAVIDKYRDATNVLFGIARWGDETRFETATFTRDPTALAQALSACRANATAMINTNYVEALDKARDYLETDMRLHENEHVDYVVEFITDGMPTSQTLDPPAVIVQSILDAATKVGEAGGQTHSSRLDVLLFAASVTVPREFVDLLPAMAQLGGGRYVQIYASDEIIRELPRLAEADTWVRHYQLRDVFADSRNLMVDRVPSVSAEAQLYVDSDGDGLIDAREAELGTSSTNPDTDGDGASDLVEVYARSLGLGRDPLFNEQIEPLAPEDLLDEDGDGLNGLEEGILGTNSLRPDSDDDGIPDGIEVRFGLDPKSPDENADYDDDGVSNLDEVRGHTNPKLDEGAALREQVAYSYAPVELIETVQGKSCYRFGVDNMRLVETDSLNPDQRLGGENQLVIQFLDAPQDLPQKTHGACESTSAVEFRDGLRDPNRVQLELRRYDFCD